MGRFALEPGTVVLGKYCIERVLGQGGMGTVVCARHLSLREVVAIKLLDRRLGLRDDLIRRFMREAQAATRLRSRHAVRVTDVGQLDDGTPYMVMEMLEGADLAQLAQARGPLDPGFAVDLVLQACEVLAEAHAQGIVHRDIKPSNLFATTGDDGATLVKLLDFGIAKAPELDGAPLTRSLALLGTPMYMSPEQLRSPRDVDHRTDLWSLGAVLYELLEGRRAFDAVALPDLCVQITARPTPPLVRAHQDVAAIVTRCLEKDPARRFSGAAELARALVPFSRDPAAAARDLARMQHLARERANRRGEPALQRGRLDEATAAPDDLAAPPALPARSPAIPTVVLAPPAIPPTAIVAGGARPAGTRRRAAIVIATVIAAAGAVAVAWQLYSGEAERLGDRPAPRRLAPAEVELPPWPTAAAPASPPAADAAISPAAPAPPVTPPARPAPRALADDPFQHPRGLRRKPRSEAPGAAGPGAPIAPPDGGGDPGSAAPRGDGGSGSAAPCDPYSSRLGC